MYEYVYTYALKKAKYAWIFGKICIKNKEFIGQKMQ